MDPLPDLEKLSDDALERLIAQLTGEEMRISFERRTLRERLDLLSAERDARTKGRSVTVTFDTRLGAKEAVWMAGRRATGLLRRLERSVSRVVRRRQRNRDRESMASARLERANLSFATALAATLDARDRYTAGHSVAVAIYARDIAARLRLSDGEQQLAYLCGLMHDIGKIGLPPGLLEKPGALTLAERRVMETHPEIGERILARVEDYVEIARIVRHHHERWDGQGYPDGLCREEIPLMSRIVAVAEAYHCMVSNTPYRDAMPSRVATSRLAEAVGAQFDSAVYAAFAAVLAGADEQYRLGNRADFALAQWTQSVDPQELGITITAQGPIASSHVPATD